MHDPSIDNAEIRPAEFRETVAGLVTARVEPVIGRGDRQRPPLIEDLRDLEALARRACGSRETVQIIASGRRRLGDRSEIGPSEGPFAQA